LACKESRWAAQLDSRQISTHFSLAVAPGPTPPLYALQPATSVALASIVLLLAFRAEHLGNPNAGEEDVEQFELIPNYPWRWFRCQRLFVTASSLLAE